MQRRAYPLTVKVQSLPFASPRTSTTTFRSAPGFPGLFRPDPSGARIGLRDVSAGHRMSRALAAAHLMCGIGVDPPDLKLSSLSDCRRSITDSSRPVSGDMNAVLAAHVQGQKQKLRRVRGGRLGAYPGAAVLWGLMVTS